MRTLLLTLFIISTNAFADEKLFAPDAVKDWRYTISYNIFTSHRLSGTYKDSRNDNKETKYNENNKVAGFRIAVNENIGYYLAQGLNSYNVNSVMGGVEFSSSGRDFEFGSDVGLATGYEELISGGILPFVNPFIRYNLNFSYGLTTSLKVGSMNFGTENAHVELSVKF